VLCAYFDSTDLYIYVQPARSFELRGKFHPENEWQKLGGVHHRFASPLLELLYPLAYFLMLDFGDCDFFLEIEHHSEFEHTI
jgi:hypothetical protein